MSGASSKLFHAIVGLGFAAAGCNGKTVATTPGGPVDAGDLADATASDAYVARNPSDGAIADAPPPLPIDAATIVPEFDAAEARDAAIDVASEPTPAPVK